MAIDPSNPLLNGPRRIDARPVLRLEPLNARPVEEETPSVPPVSEAEILAARTPKGAWTRATLAGWGVAWPPAKGWKERLILGLAQEPARVLAPGTGPLPFEQEPAARAGEPFVAGVSGYVPNPGSAEFDSRRHGLLAPPRVTYRRREE